MSNSFKPFWLIRRQWSKLCYQKTFLQIVQPDFIFFIIKKGAWFPYSHGALSPPKFEKVWLYYYNALDQEIQEIQNFFRKQSKSHDSMNTGACSKLSAIDILMIMKNISWYNIYQSKKNHREKYSRFI